MSVNMVARNQALYGIVPETSDDVERGGAAAKTDRSYWEPQPSALSINGKIITCNMTE